MNVASNRAGLKCASLLRAASAATFLACCWAVQSGLSAPTLIAMSDEVRSMCQQAEQMINSRQINDAIKLLNRAGSMDPNCAEVHGYLGMAYQNSGNTRQAVDEYTKALQLGPQMSFINVNLGTCYLNLNQPQQAVPYFRRYLQENPNAPDAAQVQGYIQQAGSREGQQNLRGLVEQGQTFLNQRRFNEARNAFQQVVAQQPNFAPGHFFLGYALANLGQHQQAIAEFQSSLQLDPNTKEALINIASNYQSLGDSANAVTWYERYLRENPGSSKANDVKQRIHGLQQQIKEQGGQSGMAASASADDYFASAASGGKLFRWTRMPIRVCIASGANVPGYQNSYQQVLMDAFSIWAVGSDHRLAFMLAQDPGQSDIVIDWTGDANKVSEGGRAVEGGLTKLNGQPMPDGTVAIAGARMTLLTNRGGNSLSDDDMKKVCLHEVGHALGINGHSNNNQDIMFFSESPSIWPALTKRDKATICRIYAGYPRVGN